MENITFEEWVGQGNTFFVDDRSEEHKAAKRVLLTDIEPIKDSPTEVFLGFDDGGLTKEFVRVKLPLKLQEYYVEYELGKFSVESELIEVERDGHVEHIVFTDDLRVRMKRSESPESLASTYNRYVAGVATPNEMFDCIQRHKSK